MPLQMYCEYNLFIQVQTINSEQKEKEEETTQITATEKKEGKKKEQQQQKSCHSSTVTNSRLNYFHSLPTIIIWNMNLKKKSLGNLT